MIQLNFPGGSDPASESSGAQDMMSLAHLDGAHTSGHFVKQSMNNG